MVSDLKQLQVGQTVSVERQDYACRITVLPPATPGIKVAEIGADYVVLDDEGAGVRTQIPIHFIQSITGGAETTPPSPEPGSVTQAA
jgi:hypothetical protein